MAKTYNTIPTVATGDVYTATAHNNIVENSNNFRVPPMCSAALTTSQSVPNNTETVLTFGSKTYETDSGIYGTNEFAIQTAGVYLISALITWEGNATGVRYVVIRKNGAGTAGNLNAAINYASFPPGANRFSQSFCIPLSLAAGDDIDLVVLQNSGGALNVNTYPGTFSATWQGQVS